MHCVQEKGSFMSNIITLPFKARRDSCGGVGVRGSAPHSATPKGKEENTCHTVRY